MGALRHKTQQTALLEHEQVAALKKLSQETGVPLQTYLREGVDLVLAKHAPKRARHNKTKESSK
jgi:predicted DNA-binding protein